MRALNFLIILSLMGMLYSCGSDNKTKKSSSTSPGTGIYNTDPGVNNAINNLKATHQCQQGGARLADVVFHTTNVISNSNIGGDQSGRLNPGSIGGTAAETYVGKSEINDLMIVTKYSGGFNVVLSMCPWGTAITPQTTFPEFYVDPYQGIVISTDTRSAGYGGAIAMNTWLGARYQNGETRYLDTHFYNIEQYYQ